MNKMIEMNYKSIANILSKLMMRKTLTEMNEWVIHFSAVLWTDQMTVKKSTEITSFQMFHEEKTVLFIEFDVLIWQTFS